MSSLTSDYVPVTETLLGTGSFDLYHTLVKLPPKERADKLHEMAKLACTLPEGYLLKEEDIKQADDAALKIIQFLFHAITDIFMLEHTELGKEGRTYWKDRRYGYAHPERDSATWLATVTKAGVAQQIYNILPGKVDVVGHDYHNSSGKESKSCFIETRRELLKAIADCWSRTSDAAEAVCHFDFLLKVAEKTNEEKWHDYLDLVTTAIREHDGNCQICKLESALMKLEPENFRTGHAQAHRDLFNILAIAWTKKMYSGTSSSDVIPLQLMVNIHSVLGNAPSILWNSLETEIKAIRAFADLVDTLKTLFSSSFGWQIESIDYQKKRVTVVRNVTYDYRYGLDQAKQDLFQAAEKVKEWRTTPDRHTVNVTLIIRKYGHGGTLQLQEKFNVP